VRFPAALIDRALAAAPHSFRLYDVLGQETHDFRGDNVYFTPGSCGITVLDHHTGQMRAPQTADYVRYAKLVSRLEHIPAQSTAFIAVDVPEPIQDSYRLYLSLLSCEKPVVTGAFTIPSFATMKALQVAVRGTETELEAKHIILATGSKSAPLKGVELDHDRIGTSTEALAYPEVPRHLVVIGAGYIGLELGSVWCRLGAEVTVLEYLDRILPGMDAEIAAEALKLFKRQGLKFHLSCRVTGARVTGKGKSQKCVVERAGGEPIECDRVLLAVGRVPNTDDLGLDTVKITLDDRGRIPVDDHFATSTGGVHAIGDVIRGPMLAHKAEDEGVACVERIVTGYGHVNYDAIPGVCYTEPEIASVGKTEEQLKEANVPYRAGVFQFRGNGRARALNHIDGRVKILAHKETDRILGVHIIGPRAGDLIAEAAVAIEFGASSEDLARVSHAHPTLAECLKEAALAVDNRPIHA
jgi:dihydrolipoamide dehydrogenase